MKDARTDKITAEYRLKEKALEIESLTKALHISNETIENMKKNHSKKESERVLRLRKQLKESIVRANEAETKVIENDDLKTEILGLKSHIHDLQQRFSIIGDGTSSKTADNVVNSKSHIQNPDQPLTMEDMMLRSDSSSYLRSKTKEIEAKLDRSTADAERGKALLVEKMQQITTLQTSKDMTENELLKREKELKQNEKKYKEYTLHLRDTITNNEVHIKSMKEIHRQKDEEIASYELLNMSLKSERDILTAQLNTTKKKHEEYAVEANRKQEEYAKIIVQFKETILKKEESINKSAAIMSAMEENMTMMSETLNESRVQKNGMQKSIEQITQESKEKIEMLKREVEIKAMDLKDMTTKYNRAQDIISHRDETVSSLEWKNEMIQADLDATKEKLDLNESRFTLNERSLKKQVSVMKAEIDDHENVLKSTKLQMEAKDSTIGLLTEDVTKLRANVNHLESIIQALKVEKDDSISKLNGENGKLEWQIKQ